MRLIVYLIRNIGHVDDGTANVVDDTRYDETYARRN